MDSETSHVTLVTMPNRVLALVCSLTLASVVAGCGASGRTSTASRGRERFNADGLSFTYPAGWRARRYQENSSFSSLIVDLSNQRLHAPCVTRHGRSNTTITCREPLEHLQRGSILVSWTTNGFPGWSLRHAPGSQLRVGGREAKLEVTSNSCGIGADEMMQVVIAMPASADNWYQLDACIRAPNPASSEREVRQLLRTVRFAA